MIELRFFAGLPTDETATVLDVSPETVRRDWRLARAWLKKAISRPDRVHHQRWPRRDLRAERQAPG